MQRLEARGHKAVAPDLPLDDPHAGFEDRVRPRFRRSTSLPTPSSSLVTRWGRPTQRWSRWRARLAACASVPEAGRLAPPPGAPDTFREGFPFPVERPDGTSVWDADAAIGAMYRRLPPETARALVQRLRPMAPPPGEYPLPGYPAIPTVLVYATDDEFFEPAWERFMAREAARRRADRDPRWPLPDGGRPRRARRSPRSPGARAHGLGVMTANDAQPRRPAQRM